MSGWWVAVGLVAVAGPLVAHLAARPWAWCRPCNGCGTIRDTWTGRWVQHCRRCSGYGQVEKPARRAIRDLTGGVLFRHPPEHPYEGVQLYGRANLPFSGGGRRPRRKRPTAARRSPEQAGR
ncbi:hypothetical protein EV378_1233 [Pseudonocardia endophytica]|uniref:Uncharacterized protein n=2 Tax=Pseudonocardia endophytica TaxID=401976 RepID=A0A4R1HWJ4_PSEEN|nr:hypothetical protein EV378_1233 [Pseudonocardia endophytica]